jgi:hypothetical protein
MTAWKGGALRLEAKEAAGFEALAENRASALVKKLRDARFRQARCYEALALASTVVASSRSSRGAMMRICCQS